MSDWLADVKKYDPDADEAAVAGIVKSLSLVLRDADGALVAFGDEAEVERLKESFCRKKLGVTDDDIIDAGIDAVKAQMKADRTRNRVTVYYLLAARWGKLRLFK